MESQAKDNIKRYTLGFIFDQTLSRVLLIHKQKPDCQMSIKVIQIMLQLPRMKKSAGLM